MSGELGAVLVALVVLGDCPSMERARGMGGGKKGKESLRLPAEQKGR